MKPRGKEHEILKGTDRELVARDYLGGLIIFPYKDIESIVEEENDFSIDTEPSDKLLLGELLVAKSKNVSLSFDYYANTQGSNTKATNIKINYKTNILQLRSVIEGFADIYCIIVSVITPSEKFPTIGRVARAVDHELQYAPLFRFGAEITGKVLANPIIREELQVAIGRVQMQNSYFKIENRDLLRSVGRFYF